MKHFHGQKKKKAFFEGWYLKHQNEDITIALIPAYHISHGGKTSASLQLITNKTSCLIPFPASSFQADTASFRVRLGNCFFTRNGLTLDVVTKDLYLQGSLSYGPFTPPSFDVMGPFRFIPFMQCNHGILSYCHSISGTLNINGQIIDLEGGTGYLEKDWGSSFPKNYTWTQCSFIHKDSRSRCCVMASIADIPFLFTSFTGCISTIFFGGKEYRLATYRGAKILEHTAKKTIIRQGDFLLHINLMDASPQPLSAPNMGNMNRTIHESASCRVRYQFFIRRHKLFDIVSSQASYETSI